MTLLEADRSATSRCSRATHSPPRRSPPRRRRPPAHRALFDATVVGSGALAVAAWSGASPAWMPGVEALLMVAAAHLAGGITARVWGAGAPAAAQVCVVVMGTTWGVLAAWQLAHPQASLAALTLATAVAAALGCIGALVCDATRELLRQARRRQQARAARYIRPALPDRTS